jgi:dTDP-4-dehydrorhamnose 3,5-epimerase
MRVLPCEIQGPVVIEPDVFGDARGFFMESWSRRRYAEVGLDFDFVQDNFSLSRQGTLRGLHFQNPQPQGKLVSVLQGAVFDVAVDIRRGSPTFGRWVGVELSAENRRQFFIPIGFAHGFQALSETALFHYKCTAAYSPRDEAGFRWDDPDVAIRWPLASPALSKRDAAAPLLRDLPPERLF